MEVQLPESFTLLVGLLVVFGAEAQHSYRNQNVILYLIAMRRQQSVYLSLNIHTVPITYVQYVHQSCSHLFANKVVAQ